MFRIVLRLAALLLLATGAVVLIAESSEYPGVTRAGTLIALRELVPIALTGWLNVGVLSATAAGARRAGIWLVSAGIANLALLVRTLPGAKRGSPPVSLALPVIGALLLIGVIGLALSNRKRLSRR